MTDNVLPPDFDGVFRFTNYSDEDFNGVWGGVAYLFPAMKTTPMFIRDATPIETQNIRKKFAKDLAEREYFKSEKFKRTEGTERAQDGSPRFNSIHMAGTYNISDLAPLIQKALDPLPIGKPTAVELPKERTEDLLTRDDEGELNTEPVEKTLKHKAPRPKLR